MLFTCGVDLYSKIYSMGAGVRLCDSKTVNFTNLGTKTRFLRNFFVGPRSIQVQNLADFAVRTTGSEVMRAWPRCLGAFSPISQQSLDRRIQKSYGIQT